jgi:hypothetical protein
MYIYLILGKFLVKVLIYVIFKLLTLFEYFVTLQFLLF